MLAISQQDDGKVIVGGYFSLVNGVSRTNIARVNADGTVDQTWNPAANDAVRRIVVSGTDVFVLGDFSAIGGQTRNGMAKLSTGGPGAADPVWNPNQPGNLRALAVYAAAGYGPDGGDRVSNFRGTSVRELRLVKRL